MAYKLEKADRVTLANARGSADADEPTLKRPVVNGQGGEMKFPVHVVTRTGKKIAMWLEIPLDAAVLTWRDE